MKRRSVPRPRGHAKAGHTVNLEDPEAFNRAVLDFLTAVDARRWPLRNPGSVSASAICPPEPAQPPTHETGSALTMSLPSTPTP